MLERNDNNYNTNNDGVRPGYIQRDVDHIRRLIDDYLAREENSKKGLPERNVNRYDEETRRRRQKSERNKDIVRRRSKEKLKYGLR